MTDIRQGLERLRRDGRRGAEKGLDLAAEHLLGVSRDQTPHEEGTLERSGRASREGMRAAVSFKGPYAVIQHEDLTFAHDPGRKAKYLEDPMNSERDVLGRIIGTSVRREIGA